MYREFLPNLPGWEQQVIFWLLTDFFKEYTAFNSGASKISSLLSSIMADAFATRGLEVTDSIN